MAVETGYDLAQSHGLILSEIQAIAADRLALPAAKWIGAGVSGAMLIALNLGVVGYGFVLFLISSLLWTAVGFAQREPSLAGLQAAITAINLVGMYRWLL